MKPIVVPKGHSLSCLGFRGLKAPAPSGVENADRELKISHRPYRTERFVWNAFPGFHPGLFSIPPYEPVIKFSFRLRFTWLAAGRSHESA